MTAVTIPSQSDPTLSTGVLTTRYLDGSLYTNAPVYFQMLSAPEGAIGYSDIKRVVSDGTTAEIQIPLVRLAIYRARIDALDARLG